MAHSTMRKSWQWSGDVALVHAAGLTVVAEIDYGRLHWKIRHLVEWAAGRRFVWVDDEITDADWTWVAANHSAPALLHRVDPRRGLTDTSTPTTRRSSKRGGATV
jgi:hypothetical protein